MVPFFLLFYGEIRDQRPDSLGDIESPRGLERSKQPGLRCPSGGLPGKLNQHLSLAIVLTERASKSILLRCGLKGDEEPPCASGTFTPARAPGRPAEQCPKPVIAAIDGFCLGGVWSWPCVVMSASPRGPPRFGLSEPRWSILSCLWPPQSLPYDSLGRSNVDSTHR